LGEKQFGNHLWSLVDPHDLGALQTKASHQTLLIESEGVDAAMHGVGHICVFLGCLVVSGGK
jgi:hypothetical protein